MKEITLTCPFTGLEFTALESLDGRLVVKHPLTGEDMAIKWNCSIKKYNVPKTYFKHIETCTPEKAAEILEVSRQRIAQIIKAQIIPVHYVAGKALFLMDDVLSYKETRKPGRPW